MYGHLACIYRCQVEIRQTSRTVEGAHPDPSEASEAALIPYETYDLDQAIKKIPSKPEVSSRTGC